MNINIFVVKSKKWVVTISLKLQDLLLERVIYYPYVNIYTVTSWCEIKKKDNEWHLFLNIFQNSNSCGLTFERIQNIQDTGDLGYLHKRIDFRASQKELTCINFIL